MNGIIDNHPEIFWSRISHTTLERLIQDSFLQDGNGLGWGDINEPYNGSTKLHWAVKYSKNPLVIEALLNAGANMDAPDEVGKIPTSLAEEVRNDEAVKVFKKWIAQNNQT